MVTSETLLNLYIDANILLAAAFAIWTVARWSLHSLGHRYAFGTQLRLLNIALIAVALAPLAVFVAGGLMSAGVIGAVPTLSDLIVTQYLHGAVDLRPSQFQQVMTLRHDVVGGLVGAAWGRVVLALLITGVMASTFMLVRSGLAVRRILRCGFVWRRFGAVNLIVSDRIAVPFSTRGLVQHYIVIPQAMLCDVAQLRIVIAHELQHIRQNDIAWELALELLRPVFFWNPAFIRAKRQIETLRELSCDQAVIRRRRFDVAGYGDCLLNVCRASLSRRPTATAFATVAFVQADRASVLRRRILSLPQEGGPATGSYVLGAVILCVVMFLAVALQPTTGWSHDRLMLSTIINLERLETLNTLSQRNW